MCELVRLSPHHFSAFPISCCTISCCTILCRTCRYYRWTPFLNKTMSLKAALKLSVANKSNAQRTKNLSSMNSLFVPLWVAAATDGRQLRQRLEIDAVGGLNNSGTQTLLTIYEMKSTEPGRWMYKYNPI